MVDFFFVSFDVGDEGFCVSMHGGEKRGFAIVGVTGNATQAFDLAGGVGFYVVKFDFGNDLWREGGFFFFGEIQAGSLAAFFIGSEAALGVPVFEIGELGGGGG